MSGKRMLYNTISKSMDVNKLSTPAALLFTWMISHADDDGKIRGETEYIKGTVVPMKKWTFKQVEKQLEEIEKAGLVYRWTENEMVIIEFVQWNRYQYIQKDRYKASYLPSYKRGNDHTMDTQRIQADTKSMTQDNISKVNKSETKVNDVADRNTNSSWINPKDFTPSNEGEVAAMDAWKKVEPHNSLALGTTYLYAYRKGLPTQLFYQYTSEVMQDSNIKNKGSVFREKVKEYLKQHKLI